MATTTARRLSVSHRAKSKFVRRGLRGYFEYRDLGIRRATRGKVVAHVIRARPGRLASRWADQPPNAPWVLTYSA